MHNYVLGAIATGVLTVIGTLGGVYLTQRHAAQIAREDRLESRRTLIRSELATLLVEVRALVSQAWLLIPLMAKAQFDDIAKITETDTGREMGRRNTAIQRSIATLTVVVRDPQIPRPLADLEQCIEQWPDKATGPALEANPSNCLPAIEAGFKHVGRTKRAMDSVIVAAAPLVQVSLSEDHPHTYRLRWRRHRPPPRP